MLKLYLRNCYREEDGSQGGADDTDDVQEKPKTMKLASLEDGGRFTESNPFFSIVASLQD